MSIVSSQNEAIEHARRLLLSKKTKVNNLADFVLHTKPDYKMNWHHAYICKVLDDFIAGRLKKLMLFTPPQHGKSELVSRRLPAYMLGKNPKLKFVGASYSSDLSSSFNRDVQRIIDTEEFHSVFPEVSLNRSSLRTTAQGGWLRNSDVFEIVHYGGSYKAVGVGGSLTGNPADVLDIDDPVKDFMEANSITSRNNVWDWYNSVAETRLHNDSQVLLTMTRWHEDDLAGRLLKYEADKWRVVILPAIKEVPSKAIPEDPNDPREIGAALWPARHSLERLMDIQAKSPRIFISLYQQRPSPEEGDIFKAAWFNYFLPQELPDNIKRDFQSDTAYGKEKSDNSSTLGYSIHNGNLYLWSRYKVNLPFPEFIKGYKAHMEANNYTQSSRCYIEPKASGISTIQQLKTETLSNGSKLNVMESEAPKEDKVTRAKAVSAIVESGRVYLLKNAPWVEDFLQEVKSFPNSAHDDDVDCLTAILSRELLNRTDFKAAFVDD